MEEIKDLIEVTCECAPNIALIKYWGKLDEELILPLNSSISITLDKNVICSKTSLVLIKNINIPAEKRKETKRVQIWFNNSLQEFDDLLIEKSTGKELISKKRFLSMLNEVRKNCSIKEPNSYYIRIRTYNNFPTACGLASSASGFACLALCLANAFKYNGDLTILARLGSGSACRSCHGGFVKWHSSSKSNESIASMLFPPNHWPDMKVLAFILEDEKKKISSTHGMHTSTQTSEFIKHRVKIVEEERLNALQLAIADKDFNKVGQIAIKDSNSFHAVCMDTSPPLFYLNDKSKEIIRLVYEFNEFSSGLKVFYSFDAGPNAFLFIQDGNIHEFLYIVYQFYFNDLTEEEFLSQMVIKAKNTILSFEKYLNIERKELLKSHFNKLNGFSLKNKINTESFLKYLIHSDIGENPSVYFNDWDISLLDRFGNPK